QPGRGHRRGREHRRLPGEPPVVPRGRRRRTGVVARLGGWFDDRLGAAHFARTALDKIFPDHWSFMLGEVALYCFVTLVLTGIYLTFFFNPSSHDVVYHGIYGPLNGLHMSEAYRSTIR